MPRTILARNAVDVRPTHRATRLLPPPTPSQRIPAGEGGTRLPAPGCRLRVNGREPRGSRPVLPPELVAPASTGEVGPCSVARQAGVRRAARRIPTSRRVIRCGSGATCNDSPARWAMQLRRATDRPPGGPRPGHGRALEAGHGRDTGRWPGDTRRARTRGDGTPTVPRGPRPGRRRRSRWRRSSRPAARAPRPRHAPAARGPSTARSPRCTDRTTPHPVGVRLGHEDRVDREAHEHHVDPVARGQPQTVARRPARDGP